MAEVVATPALHATIDWRAGVVVNSGKTCDTTREASNVNRRGRRFRGINTKLTAKVVSPTLHAALDERTGVERSTRKGRGA